MKLPFSLQTLTFKPLLLVQDKKILGLSKDCETTTGVCRLRLSHIMLSTAFGAVAVTAMIGTSVRALSPPILSKLFLKSEPLEKENPKLNDYHAINSYHSNMQCASSTATTTRRS